VILIFARRDYGALGALKRRLSSESAVRDGANEWLSPKPNDSQTGEGGIARASNDLADRGADGS